MMQFNPGGPRGLNVYYDSWMEGGGTWFGQEYIELIKQRYTRTFEKCYEWCSGPGFIGFGILDHELCKKVCLSDIYEPAINQAVKTTSGQCPR